VRGVGVGGGGIRWDGIKKFVFGWVGRNEQKVSSF